METKQKAKGAPPRKKAPPKKRATPPEPLGPGRVHVLTVAAEAAAKRPKQAMAAAVYAVIQELINRAGSNKSIVKFLGPALAEAAVGLTPTDPPDTNNSNQERTGGG